MSTAIYRVKASELNGAFIHGLQDDYGSTADVEIKVYPSGSNGRVTEDFFWEIVGLLDWGQTDNQAITAPVVEKLASLSVRQLYEFQDMLSEKLYLLDGEKYARHIGQSAYKKGKPFSVDHFLDVRSCVVANGREYFNHVLNHPEEMPKDTWFESLLYVVPKAYRIKTGKEFSYLPAFNYQTYGNHSGWQ